MPKLIQTIRRKCHRSKARFVLFCLTGQSNMVSHCNVMCSTCSICALFRSRRGKTLWGASRGHTSPPEHRDRPSWSCSWDPLYSLAQIRIGIRHFKLSYRKKIQGFGLGNARARWRRSWDEDWSGPPDDKTAAPWDVRAVWDVDPSCCSHWTVQGLGTLPL